MEGVDVYCPNCGWIGYFEPEEFGINYFQAVGDCELCGEQLYYKDGEPTKEIITFRLKDNNPSEEII